MTWHEIVNDRFFILMFGFVCGVWAVHVSDWITRKLHDKQHER